MTLEWVSKLAREPARPHSSNSSSISSSSTNSSSSMREATLVVSADVAQRREVAMSSSRKVDRATKLAAEIQPWDSDHTALVHVLWAAEDGGITISDADELASHIMRSTWMKAVQQHAVERRADAR